MSADVEHVGDEEAVIDQMQSDGVAGQLVGGTYFHAVRRAG
jgi:hypothetical protein